MKLTTAIGTILLGVATATSAVAGTVTRDGNILTVSGDVDFNMWQQWDQLFDPNEITHVKLKSPGGQVYYGTLIADEIYDNRATVYTEATGECASMCAEMWLAADKHVYNFNQEVGFHVSSITDSDYWKDYMFDWGWKNVEAAIKRQAIRDLQLSFKYFDNKAYFNEYMEGLADEGDYAHKLFVPSKSMLARWEGNFVSAPEYKADVFEPKDTGWGITNNGPNVWYKGNEPHYRVPLQFTIQKDAINQVNVSLHDANGLSLDVGYDKTEIQWDYIYDDGLSKGDVVKYNMYSVDKPVWLRIATPDDSVVRWFKLR